MVVGKINGKSVAIRAKSGIWIPSDRWDSKKERMVTVIDPLTREEKQVPINEIASSHMARKTFCGNLYRSVKDPDLVGSLSGHAHGSAAFTRYRDIDDDMKQELVRELE